MQFDFTEAAVSGMEIRCNLILLKLRFLVWRFRCNLILLKLRFLVWRLGAI